MLKRFPYIDLNRDTLFFDSDIPDYLHASPHYQEIVRDESFPACGLEFPIGCVKKDMHVGSLADVVELLQTLRFWLLPDLVETSTELITFCIEQINSPDVMYTFCQFSKDFPFIEDLVSVAKVRPMYQVVTAVKLNRLTILRYLHGVVRRPADQEAGKLAASKGYLNSLKYMHSVGLKLTNGLVTAAIIDKRLSVLKYLLDQGAELEPQAIVECACYGRLDCLQLLMERNCPIDEFCTLTDAFSIASENGKVDCIEYLWQKFNHLNKRRFEKCILNGATENGQLDVFKFAVENNFLIVYYHDILQRLAYFERSECIEYLKSVGITLDAI